jgi:hypothetical protein
MLVIECYLGTIVYMLLEKEKENMTEMSQLPLERSRCSEDE